MECDPVMALIKFGAAEHMTELLLRGHLHMRPIRFFRSLEGDAFREDQHEGLARCVQADRFRLDVRQGDKWVSVGGIVGQVLIHDHCAEVGNLYCMFALRESHADAVAEGRSAQFIEVENLAFGDSAVVFTDHEEFMRRVCAEAEHEWLDLSYDLAEYVDRETHSGPMGPFRKFSAFVSQSEFRILAKPEIEPVRTLTLGSLEDIAFMCPTAEINGWLRPRAAVEPAQQAGAVGQPAAAADRLNR